MEVFWNRGTPKSYPIRRFRLGFEGFIDSVSDVLRLLLQPLWQLQRDIGCDELLNRLLNLSDVRLGLYDGPKSAARRQLTPCLLVSYSCLREGNFEFFQPFARGQFWNSPNHHMHASPASQLRCVYPIQNPARFYLVMWPFAFLLVCSGGDPLCNFATSKGPEPTKLKGQNIKFGWSKKSKPLNWGFWRPWIGDFGFTQQYFFFGTLHKWTKKTLYHRKRNSHAWGLIFVRPYYHHNAA